MCYEGKGHYTLVVFLLGLMADFKTLINAMAAKKKSQKKCVCFANTYQMLPLCNKDSGLIHL